MVEHLGVENKATWSSFGAALEQLGVEGQQLHMEACKWRALACAYIYSWPKLTCNHYEIFIKFKMTLKILTFLHNILDIYMYV